MIMEVERRENSPTRIHHLRIASAPFVTCERIRIMSVYKRGREKIEKEVLKIILFTHNYNHIA